MENFHTNQVNNLLRRRWTQEEEVVVLNNIKNFPDNLHEAFRASARQLENRNVHSIEQKYYSTLKLKYPNLENIYLTN